MTKQCFWRIWGVLSFGVWMALASNEGQAQTLPPEVTRALAQAGVPASAISVVVQALPLTHSSDKQEQNANPTAQASALIAHRSQASVNPASVMKLITTYAALDQLGEKFTWKNRVYIDGVVEGGVLRGNLILRGSGDPKLVLERIDDLFKQVMAKGVRDVQGDIVLDRRVFNLPEKNPADFDDEPLRPYNAAPDGLLLNFKSLIFTFTPDPSGQKVLVRSEPPMAGVAIPTEVSASHGPCGDWRSGLRADFSRADQVSFSGKYPLSCGERVWPVAYVAPQSYARRVVEAMWRGAGGQISGGVRDGDFPRTARLLLTAESLPLADIIADVNKFSNNVMAQQVFLTMSSVLPAPGRTGSFEASRRNLVAWWKERLPEQKPPVLDNGSGLSRNERSSAAAINALLQLAAGSAQAQVFAQSLGIAGVDGTVARMRDRNSASVAIGQAQLKTGTLKDVAAVAGYAHAQNGQKYSLVAIVNHPNAGAARPALDALVEWVVKQR